MRASKGIGAFSIVLAVLFIAAVARVAWNTEAQPEDPIYYSASRSERVRDAYRIAREIPDVLAKIPCHCGCMKSELGHGASLDCFKTNHAETCAICVLTAQHAYRLAKAGKTVPEIQRYINNVFTFQY